ncbi:MAG: fructose-1,6-bisphosphatase II [Bradymonadia bacterium]|jgi:fructose-1,6-bisphosphatase II
MDRNLALEFVRVTEAAAIAAARTMGRGDSHLSDDAAVEAMRSAFKAMDIDGTIVIGEGERDEAPMLYIGERVGAAGPESPKLDIALDPLEGTGLCAYGRAGALAVIAAGSPGCLMHAPDIYMDKIAVGPVGRGVIDIMATPAENVRQLAKAKGCQVEDLTVIILDRSRHEDIIREVREVGARIKLIADGDVHAAIACCKEETGIDLLLGIGGAPEGVLAAAALQCIGGDMQGKLVFRNEREKERAKKMMGDRDIHSVFSLDDLAHGNIVFSATGVTTGDMLRGVRFLGDGCETHSVVMRNKSGTVRFVEARHNFWRKPSYNAEGEVQPPTNGSEGGTDA